MICVKSEPVSRMCNPQDVHPVNWNSASVFLHDKQDDLPAIETWCLSRLAYGHKK